MSKSATYTHFVRQALFGHALVGLVLGALVYQVCLTGALSVFAGDLRMLEQPDAPVVASVQPEAFERLLDAGIERVGEPGQTIILLGPTEQYPRFELRLDGGEHFYATKTGEIAVQAATPWIDTVTELHENLHLPSFWGSVLMGIAGIALLTSLVTGIAAHARIWRDLFHVRLGGSARLEQVDFHNRAGVWLVPVYLVIAFSGAYLSWAPTLGPLVAPLAESASQPAPEQVERAVAGQVLPTPRVAAIIRSLENENDPATVSFVMLTNAGTPDQRLFVDTDVPKQLASGESYRFDGMGRALGPVGFADGSVGHQIAVAMFPLHFGNFAGLPIRLAYGATGLLLCWLVASGMRIWFLRSAQAGRHMPVRERLWAAFMWGQPVALVFALVLSFAGLSALASYAALSLLTVLPAAARSNPIVFRVAYQALAAAGIAIIISARLSPASLPAQAMIAIGLLCLATIVLIIGAVASWQGRRRERPIS